MKITKRQLKQIIREEYSRLKRRGLIKESKDQALEMINYLETGTDLGTALDFSDLKELVSNGDKEGALAEIGYFVHIIHHNDWRGLLSQTYDHNELLEELERLIEQM